MSKKIVLFSTRCPGPIRKGDQTILDAKIRFLSNSNEVILICPRLNANEHSFFQENYAGRCKLLEYRKYFWDLCWGFFRCFRHKIPFHHALFFSSKAQNLLAKLEQPVHIHFILSRSVINYSGDLSKHSIDFIDSGYLALRNRVSRGVFLKSLLSFDSERARRFESNLALNCQFSSAVSAKDAAAIDKSVAVIPNGVEVNDIKKEIDVNQKTGRLSLVITGNFDYPPNREGAENTIKMLRRSKLVKDVSLTLIGYSSDKFLNEKLLTGDIGCSVSALGEVEDMKLALVEHDVSVALMTTGTGIQNKVLEAFAVGLPVVLSEKVLQGLPVKNPPGFLLARNVAEFDASIATLMNPRNRKIMGEGNRIHCEQNYNWQSGIRKLQKNILSKV